MAGSCDLAFFLKYRRYKQHSGLFCPEVFYSREQWVERIKFHAPLPAAGLLT